MIICNPSIARFEENDPAVTGYVSRARALGFGGVVLTSLFALRGDDAAASISDDYRIGAFNDQALLEAAKRSAKVICVWGNRGASSHRSSAVIKLLSKKAHCFARHRAQSQRLTRRRHHCIRWHWPK